MNAMMSSAARDMSTHPGAGSTTELPQPPSGAPHLLVEARMALDQRHDVAARSTLEAADQRGGQRPFYPTLRNLQLPVLERFLVFGVALAQIEVADATGGGGFRHEEVQLQAG